MPEIDCMAVFHLLVCLAIVAEEKSEQFRREGNEERANRWLGIMEKAKKASTLPYINCNFVEEKLKSATNTK